MDACGQACCGESASDEFNPCRIAGDSPCSESADPLPRTELEVLVDELTGLPQSVRRRLFLRAPIEGAGLGLTTAEEGSSAPR